MFDCLLTNSLLISNIDLLKRFPEHLLNDLEKEGRQWVIDYFDNYNQAPTPERFESENRIGVLLNVGYKNTPIEDVYDLALERKKNQYLLRELSEIFEKIDNGEKINASVELSKISDRLNVGRVTPAISIFDFNRDDLYSPQEMRGVKFGFGSLDSSVGGLFEGELAYLVGLVGSGKTTIGSYLTYKWFLDGLKILHVSGEQTEAQIVAKFDAIAAGFNPFIFRDKTGKEKELAENRKRVDDIYSKLKATTKGDILFPKRKIATVYDIRDAVNDLAPDVLVVDGVYLIGASSSGQDWQNMSEVSKELKQIARTHNIPVFATTQFKRQNDGKTMDFDLNDIAFASAFAMDGDLVLGGYKVPQQQSHVIEVLKARSAVGLVSTQFKINWQNMTFEEVDF